MSQNSNEPSTFRAAKTICELSNWKISNLPLQKLLYISHMVHLGVKGIPLMDGHFEAWDLGPVEPRLYQKVKAYGSNPIVDIFPLITYNPESSEFQTLSSVFHHLQHVSPGTLVAMTHWSGGAWAKHYKPNVHGIVIPNEDILREYRDREAGKASQS